MSKVSKEIILIAAISKNNYIGLKNKLPWSHKEDLKRFKNFTEQHVVLMGRKTFDSINLEAGLPKRVNVVLTRNKKLKFHKNIIVIENLNLFLNQFLNSIVLKNQKKLFIIGGAEIYQQTLKFCTSLELSYFDFDVKGDTLFPFSLEELEKDFKFINIEKGYDVTYYSLKRN